MACLLFLSLAACTPVAVSSALDETEANAIVVALDHAKIGAWKEVDPTQEGRYRVSVSHDDAASAIAVLRDEELPKRRPTGVLEAAGKGGLVPSQAAEHAHVLAGIAGELERSLQSIDGILTARVHIDVPQTNPLDFQSVRKSVASVLIEHRGSTPPLPTESVQKLIAGAVSGIAPNEVAVVLVPRPAPAAPREANIASVGPFAVARGSVRPLQSTLVSLVALVALLAATTIALSLRLSRFRAANPGD